jgi:hypothetical protein
MRLQDEESSDLPLFEKQLRETETAIDNIVNVIMNGLASKALQTKLTQLEDRKEELNLLIAQEKLEKPKISAEFFTYWLEQLRQLDMSKEKHRQMLIDTFVNAIFLYDDKLLLTFNFKDLSRTITFSDVEALTNENGSDLDCSAAPKKQIPIRVSAFLHVEGDGLEPIKCNMPGACCLPLAGWRQHLNFCPKGKNANRVRSPCLFYGYCNRTSSTI